MSRLVEPHGGNGLNPLLLPSAERATELQRERLVASMPDAPGELTPAGVETSCPACETPLAAEDVACSECGLAFPVLEISCPACFEPTPTDEGRCMSCGHSLDLGEEA